ncbi:hypothetical protein GJ629_08535 [Halapricum sp. CBA1109]|uniref:hypothetical protein n=1 Tax=Halapricum sp. CBA1109 TaxID=2668068 RepID=UPI0012F91CC3|nr:hypothetical protein [Halapricum sp. CBA1109]MUV89934.1 hypothetical protein [Halapricum sp. CBA1109]
MERLSSCYFCGDAVDASVAEYSLVESERYDIDTDHRIVLCPTCRRKLTDVIERVVSAVFDDDRDPEAVAAGPEDDPMTATDVQAVEGDSLEVTDDPLVDVDGTENGATEAEDDGENEDAVAEGGAEAATVGSEGGDESDSEMGDNETSDGDGWAGEADEDDGTVEANDSEGETVVARPRRKESKRSKTTRRRQRTRRRPTRPRTTRRRRPTTKRPSSTR